MAFLNIYQIIKQNSFLHNIVIIPLMNIDYDNMYSDIILKILTIPSIKIVEETHFIHSTRKWLVIITDKLKQQAQIDINSIIEKG